MATKNAQTVLGNVFTQIFGEDRGSLNSPLEESIEMLRIGLMRGTKGWQDEEISDITILCQHLKNILTQSGRKKIGTCGFERNPEIVGYIAQLVVVPPFMSAAAYYEKFTTALDGITYIVCQETNCERVDLELVASIGVTHD